VLKLSASADLAVLKKMLAVLIVLTHKLGIRSFINWFPVQVH